MTRVHDPATTVALGEGHAPPGHPAISTSGLGEVDHYGSMIGRLLTLAGVPIPKGSSGALHEVVAHEHEVDAQTTALVEVSGPVVPPRERAGFVETAEHVVEAPPFDCTERGALGLAHVRRT